MKNLIKKIKSILSVLCCAIVLIWPLIFGLSLIILKNFQADKGLSLFSNDLLSFLLTMVPAYALYPVMIINFIVFLAGLCHFGYIRVTQKGAIKRIDKLFLYDISVIIVIIFLYGFNLRLLFLDLYSLFFFPLWFIQKI